MDCNPHNHLETTFQSHTFQDMMCSAAKSNDVEALIKILHQTRGIVYLKNRRTAMHYGAANGHTKVIQLLYQRGYQVNEQDDNGATPLILAASKGHRDVVQLLIDYHADPNTQNKTEHYSPLHVASIRGYSQTVEILCRSGANVNIANKFRFTPLHVACQYGHKQTSIILVTHGADPNLPNTYGDTSLHTAARYGFLKVFHVLLSKCRIDLNATNRNGDTALHVCASLNRIKMVSLLLEQGADNLIKNRQGVTALDVAKQKHHLEVFGLIKGLAKNANYADSIYALLDSVSPQTSSRVHNQENILDESSEEVDSISLVNEGRAALQTSQNKPMPSIDQTGNDLQSKVEFPDKPVVYNVVPAAEIVDNRDSRKKSGIKASIVNFFKKLGKKDKEKDKHKSGDLISNPVLARYIEAMQSGYMPVGMPFQYYQDLAGNVKQGPVGFPWNCGIPPSQLPCSCNQRLMPQIALINGKPSQEYAPCQDHGYVEYHGRFEAPEVPIRNQSIGLPPVHDNNCVRQVPDLPALPAGRLFRSRSDESLAMSESKQRLKQQRANQWAQRTSKCYAGHKEADKEPITGRKEQLKAYTALQAANLPANQRDF